MPTLRFLLLFLFSLLLLSSSVVRSESEDLEVCDGECESAQDDDVLTKSTVRSIGATTVEAVEDDLSTRDGVATLAAKHLAGLDDEALAALIGAARAAASGKPFVRHSNPDDDASSAQSDASESKQQPEPSGPSQVTCADLEIAYDRGFLNTKQRNDYCSLKCNFLRLNCDAEAPKKAYDIAKPIKKFLSNLSEDEIYSHDESYGFDDDVWNVWNSIFFRNWTIALALIPIALNQYKQYNWFWASFMLVLCFVGFVFDLCPVAVTAHNCFVVLLCAALPANSAALGSTVLATIAGICVVCAAFMKDSGFQLVFFACAILGYFIYLYHVFFVRRANAGAAVFVLFLQIFILFDCVEFVRENYALKSLVDVAMEIIMRCILPNGRSMYFFRNALWSTSKIVKYFDVEDEDKRLSLAVGTYALQMFMFAAYRASLGAFYIHSLRFKKEPRILFDGFVVYCVDFFGPFNAAWRILLQYETVNPRRCMYAMHGLVSLWFEFRGARGMLYIRMVATFIDVILVQSGYQNTTHYLEYNVDACQQAFPQFRAMPWISLSQLAEAAESTGVLLAVKSGGLHRGIGFALDCAGRTMLYTVEHVTRGISEFVFAKNRIVEPHFEPVTTKGDDPMVAAKMDGIKSVAMELLTPTEACDVVQLLFINVIMDEKHRVVDKPICFINEFSKVGDKLHASVNLMKGDSGGPCFAVLKSGILRFCGVVSRGNPRRGGGNIVSFCYSDNVIGCDSSSEDDGEGEIAQFNRVRRAKYCTDDANIVRYAAADRLRLHLKECENFYTDVEFNLHAYFPWDELDDHGRIVKRLMSEDIDLGYGYEDDSKRLPDEDEGEKDEREGIGDENPGKGKHRKGNQKRRWKIKAAKKRGHLEQIALRYRLLREMLLAVYSDEVSETIYGSVTSSGRIPKLDKRVYIQNSDGGDYMVASELPDPHWI